MGKVDMSGYETKINQSLSKTMQEWWDGLTKEDLLCYMSEQPQITADFIRQMLASEKCVMGIGVKFHMGTKDAISNFRADQR